MKKFLLVLVCAACGLTASAQYASDASTGFFSVEKSDQPITFGVRGGVNFAKQAVSSDGYSFSAKNNLGFNVGVSVDIPFLESLYLQSGLYYTGKGYKFDEDGYEEKVNLSYLQIPVLASYRYNFSEAAQLQINVGPYFAYGIDGKYKCEEDGEKWEEDAFSDDEYKKFDMGLTVGAGITFGHIFVGANYDFGLTNIMNGLEGGSLKNRCLSISVGYNF